MDKTDDNIGDITYRILDYIYSEDDNLFGQIVGLYMRDTKKFADVKLFETTEIDPETNINYAKQYDATRRKFLFLEKLSNPLVVGIETNEVWFISKVSDIDTFCWLNDHALL